MMLMILAVSLYDGFLTIKYQGQLKSQEENPLARVILAYDNWQIDNFLIYKTIGTFLTLFILIILNFYSKFGYFITFVIFMLQLILLFCYLRFDDLQ